MVREKAGHAEQDVARGVARALDDPLARGNRSSDVSPSPGIGEVERRRLRTGRDELRDLALADPLAVGPGGELVDLGRELVGVLADELDQRASRLGVDPDAALGELRLDPARQIRPSAPGFVGTS